LTIHHCDSKALFAETKAKQMGVISLTKDWIHVGKQRHLSAACIAAIVIIGIQVNNDSNACC
jgi:hypothetical protein